MSIGSRTETALEVHRREFNRIEGRGPLMRVEELTPSELKLINSDFLARCRGSAEDINQIYLTYAQTLHDWGVICPHPQLHRRYDGFQQTDIPLRFDESRWYECCLCSASVINR